MMSYQRLYPQRINWEDEPSLATPINQVNLNKMDAAIYGIDGRVVELDENKAGKNDTFNTSRNGVVPKPTQADITNEKVLRADGTWVTQSGGGGGGGGHKIVNNAGTELTQRSKLKTVGGLNATDDSVNDTTEITDVYEEIPWTTWQGYSDAQKAQHPNAIITGAPDCDGDIEIENMHLAWTNPSPTTDFTSQQITLNTDGNYNRIRVEFCYSTSFVNLRKSVDFQKGNGAFMDLTYAYPTNSNYSRTITPVSDTKIQIDTCYSGGAQSDNMLVPIAVYTYKDDLTAKIQAIARNVSTEASKCMLDENTSVADRLTWKPLSSATGTSNINFPSNWDEIAVSAMQTTGSSACVGRITKAQVEDIITASVYNSAYVTIGGGYENSSSYFHLIALITATQMSLTFYAAGTDISASTKFDVKYR